MKNRRSTAFSVFVSLCLALACLAGCLTGSRLEESALEPLYYFENQSVSSDIRIGDEVYFGQYPQTSTGAKRDISWIVLDIRDGRALLLSKYILDVIPYHRRNESVTWETCSIREWLNNTFLKTAFSSSELQSVATVTIENDSNAEYHISGGRRTTDRVFLLSYGDATSYFWANADRSANATEYALGRGVFVDDETGASWWWLRSPGKTADRAGNVVTGGTPSTYGGYVASGEGGVRPALWVQTSALRTSASGNAYHPSAPSFGSYGNLRVGSTLKFGRYEQDDVFSNGLEPIEWIVLDIQDGRALLISKYCLDAKPYNETWVDVTWESCTLRAWLNNEFLNKAFNSSELRQISLTSVYTPDNNTYGTRGGRVTQDLVFILSVQEASGYFSSDIARRATGTTYALNETQMYLDEDYPTESGADSCWWRLRTPGMQQSYVARVMTSGFVYNMGDVCHYVNGGIRPCIWLNLS